MNIYLRPVPTVVASSKNLEKLTRATISLQFIYRRVPVLADALLVSCPINNMAFVAIKMGRRQGARSGAYLNGYVTDEQRSRRPIFIATLRAVASWLFFRVARSLRINADMLVVTASPARTALKNSQLTDGESHAIYGIGH